MLSIPPLGDQASSFAQARKLRIVHSVPTIQWEASGPSQSVPSLCAALARSGHDVELASVGGAWTRGNQPYRHFLAPRDFERWPILRELWFSSGLRRELASQAEAFDLVHSHSLWVMPNLYPALVARRSGKPLVVSPRGTLSAVALARSRWLKAAFWTVLQGPAVRSATCLHATSEQEYSDIRRAGLRQPVAIIPNGVDIPEASAETASQGSRTLLYLGRLHPIKGLDNLLRAWQAVVRQFPEWNLRLVGPDEDGHRAELERLVSEFKIERVSFAGPRYGADKGVEYAAADLFVLPSHTENFGMSVAEALAHGIPVITTTGTPWSRVVEQCCGWYVSPDVSGLSQALGQALPLGRPALGAMGAAGRAWMQREFSWDRIARDFVQLYRWILEGGPPPASVRIA